HRLPCAGLLGVRRARPGHDADHDSEDALTAPHWTLPSNVTAPRPAGPSHSIVIGQAPAIPNSAVTVYTPATPVGCTCALPGMTMPGMGMLAPTRTVPTSTSAPEAARNSMVKVFRPLRSVPVDDRTITSISPDCTVCTTPPSVEAPVRGAPDRANQTTAAPTVTTVRRVITT